MSLSGISKVFVIVRMFLETGIRKYLDLTGRKKKKQQQQNNNKRHILIQTGFVSIVGFKPQDGEDGNGGVE